MKWVKTILWMIIFFLAIFFSIQNRDEVTLRLGFYPFLAYPELEQRMPLFLVLLCALLLGVLIGGFSELYVRFQLKRTLRQNLKTIDRLEQEIRALKKAAPEELPPGKKNG
jgi:uncharacterized integral membrane protein